jgi:AcrR family transcriptional regulator
MSPRTNAQNIAKREQTRQQILMTALKAFAEKGYGSTSMSYIAKAAGVSKGLSYHYYNSKHDLLVGIFEMLSAMASSAEDLWEGKSAKEKLSLTIDLTFTYFKEQTDIVRFMTALALQPEVTMDLKDLLAQQKSQSLGLYKDLFDELGYSDPETEAYAFGALLDGTAIGFLALNSSYPLDKLKDNILSKYNL